MIYQCLVHFLVYDNLQSNGVSIFNVYGNHAESRYCGFSDYITHTQDQ